MSQSKRLPVMEDYLKHHYLGDPCARGGLLAWTVSWWDQEAPVGFRRFREAVHLARIGGDGLKDEQIITAGGKTERCAAIAQDGAVWFLSDASLETPYPEDGTVPQRVVNELFSQMQLYRWQNGETKKLTAMRHGVERFFLSPDEQRVFFLCWKYDGDADITSEYTGEERAALLEQRLDEPFITEKQRYKADAEMGWRSERSQTLWLWENGNVRCLMDEEADFSAPCWLGDSRRILYQRSAEDRLTFRTLDVQTGADTGLATVDNVSLCFEDDYAPLIDEKNQQILFAANTPGMEYADPRGLYAIPLSGGTGLTARRLLSPDKDVDGVLPQDFNFTSRDCCGAEYALMPDGTLCYATGYRGDVHIAAVSALAQDAEPRMITPEMKNYHCLSVLDDDHLLTLCGVPTCLPEVAAVNIRTGETVFLTHSNPWMDDVLLGAPESVWTEDGTHGFYLPPAGNREKAPAILYCHGGPTGFYCSALNYEMHALAAAGFGVLYPNPRGGTGYGRERSKDEFAYDGTAMKDLLSFVETVCDSHPELDRDNVGICGGSYGGFLTLHVTSRCDRFKAACSHRALSNMQMISASSHSAGGHTRESTPVYLDHIREQIKESPTTYMDKIRTPLLILQSALDANCVPEQANQAYTAMRAWNPDVPCEYILYPDSCHGIHHRGPAELALQHRNANLNWFRKYLQKEEQA